MLIGDGVNRNKICVSFVGAYLVAACVVLLIMVVPMVIPFFLMAGTQSIWFFILYQGCKILCATAAGRAAAEVDNQCCKYYAPPRIRLGKINIDLPFLGLLTGFIVSIVVQNIVIVKFLPE